MYGRVISAGYGERDSLGWGLVGQLVGVPMRCELIGMNDDKSCWIKLHVYTHWTLLYCKSNYTYLK